MFKMHKSNPALSAEELFLFPWDLRIKLSFEVL